MAQVVTYSGIMWVDTLAYLKTLSPAIGTYAYAQDVKTFYFFTVGGWQADANASTTPPAAVAGSGAGTGASITLEGNNRAGKITFVQGTGGVASGAIMVLTLADSVAAPNGLSITFASGNSNFAGVYTSIYCQSSKTTVTLYLNGLVLTAGNTYIGYYKIEQY